MFDWVENRSLAKVGILNLHLFQVYKLSREKNLPENMCHIVFAKTKCRGGRVNRMSVYAEAAVRRVLLKKCYEKFSRIHRKTSVLESLF